MEARQAAQTRQQAAALYQAHALGLVKLAVLMVGDQRAAEDVVQDAFLGLYRRWSALQDRVAFCILRKKATGEQFLSVKRREAINDWLEEFAAKQGWAGQQAVVNANVVRSFLIHNGVLIQGPVWRG